MSVREERQDKAARTGQRVNEDEEGEKGAQTVCAHTLSTHSIGLLTYLVRANWRASLRGKPSQAGDKAPLPSRWPDLSGLGR